MHSDLPFLPIGYPKLAAVTSIPAISGSFQVLAHVYDVRKSTGLFALMKPGLIAVQGRRPNENASDYAAHALKVAGFLAAPRANFRNGVKTTFERS